MATEDGLEQALEDNKQAKQAREHWNCVCGHVVDESYQAYQNDCLDLIKDAEVRLDAFYQRMKTKINHARSTVETSKIKVTSVAEANLRRAKDDMWKAKTASTTGGVNYRSGDILEIEQSTECIYTKTENLKSELLKVPSFIAVGVNAEFSKLINSRFDPIEIERGGPLGDDKNEGAFHQENITVENKTKPTRTASKNKNINEQLKKNLQKKANLRNNVQVSPEPINSDSSEDSDTEAHKDTIGPNRNTDTYDDEQFESDISTSSSEEEIEEEIENTKQDKFIVNKFEAPPDLISDATKKTFQARSVEQSTREKAPRDTIKPLGDGRLKQMPSKPISTVKRKTESPEEIAHSITARAKNPSKLPSDSLQLNDLGKMDVKRKQSLGSVTSRDTEQERDQRPTLRRSYTDYQSRSIGSRRENSARSKSEEIPISNDSISFTSECIGDVEIQSIPAVVEPTGSIATENAIQHKEENHIKNDGYVHGKGGGGDHRALGRETMQPKVSGWDRPGATTPRTLNKHLKKRGGHYVTQSSENVRHFTDLLNQVPEFPVLPAIHDPEQGKTTDEEPRCISRSAVEPAYEMKVLDGGFFAFQQCADIKLFKSYFVVSANDKLFKVDRNTNKKLHEMKIEGASKMCAIRGTSLVGLIQTPSYIMVISTENMTIEYKIKTVHPYTSICYLDRYHLDGHLPKMSFGFIGAYSGNDRGVVVEALEIVRAGYKKQMLGQKTTNLAFDANTWPVEHTEVKTGIYSIDTFSANEIVVCSARSVICLLKHKESGTWIEKWKIPLAKEATCVFCTKQIAYICIRDEMRIMAVDREGTITDDNILPNKDIKPDKAGYFEDTVLVKEFHFEKWRTLVCEPGKQM